MLIYLLKRLLLMVPTLFGVLLITFCVIQFVPGGPVEQYLAEAKTAPGGGVEGAAFTYRGGQGVDPKRLAEIKALYEVTPLLGLCAELGGNVDVRYVQGYVAQGAGEQSADWQRESLSDTSARARAWAGIRGDELGRRRFPRPVVPVAERQRGMGRRAADLRRDQPVRFHDGSVVVGHAPRGAAASRTSGSQPNFG